jgi:hypothetical protein
MLTDLLRPGEFATAALPMQQHLQAGTLRAIGVGTAQRVPPRRTFLRSSSKACLATWSKRGRGDRPEGHVGVRSRA